MGGKPSKGTPKDKRLKENQQTNAVPIGPRPFPAPAKPAKSKKG